MDFKDFAALASAFEGGRDIGATIPASDAKDFHDGARYIPGEVTLARRNGERVTFDRGAQMAHWPQGDPAGSSLRKAKAYVEKLRASQ